MKKMRAMVLSECAPIETNPLKLTEIDRHEIKKPDEILLKIEACGVCHSQLHGIEGDWKDIGIPPTLPTVPGHILLLLQTVLPYDQLLQFQIYQFFCVIVVLQLLLPCML